MCCRLFVVILVNIFNLNLLEFFFFHFGDKSECWIFFLILKWAFIDFHCQLILFFPPTQRSELSKCSVFHFYFFEALF